jgi:hypothetical protein
VKVRAATIIPSVTIPTPMRAAALGTSESNGIAASVVTQGTAATKSPAAAGPSAATARV